MGGLVPAGARVGFRDALRNRTFVLLFLAETQSIIGDQLARVSLAILVFDRTASASATALVFALTYLPAIVGGVVLGGLGDRWPRRAVMIGCDVFRAATFACMAIGGIPLGWLMAMLAVAVFTGPAFTSAQVSYLAANLPSEIFRVGTGLRMIAGQSAQVAGFAIGGTIVAAIGAREALLVNASTFIASIALIASATGGAERARTGAPEVSAASTSVARSNSALMRNGRIARLLALSALAGLFIVPEGLAVPYAADLGVGPVRTGLLLAALPLGGAVGVVVLLRVIPPAARPRAARVMAIGCGLPLIGAIAIEHWLSAALCWFVSGVLAAYQVEVLTAMMQAAPDSMRSRLVGIGSSVLLGAQGIGLAAAGWLADATAPDTAIASAGAVGAALAVILGAWMVRSRDDEALRTGLSAGSDTASRALVRGRHRSD